MERTISKEVSKSRQNAYYRETLKLNDNKLKVVIKSNPYSFQSSAKIEKWDGDKWNLVHNLGKRCTPDGLSDCPEHLYKEDLFKKDRNELVRVAKEVLL